MPRITITTDQGEVVEVIEVDDYPRTVAATFDLQQDVVDAIREALRMEADRC